MNQKKCNTAHLVCSGTQDAKVSRANKDAKSPCCSTHARTHAHTNTLTHSNLSEALQLHFVLAEEQLHLLQLVLQRKVVLQQPEVELQREDGEGVRH